MNRYLPLYLNFFHLESHSEILELEFHLEFSKAGGDILGPRQGPKIRWQGQRPRDRPGKPSRDWGCSTEWLVGGPKNPPHSFSGAVDNQEEEAYLLAVSIEEAIEKSAKERARDRFVEMVCDIIEESMLDLLPGEKDRRLAAFESVVDRVVRKN